jgi:hypothetical protein
LWFDENNSEFFFFFVGGGCIRRRVGPRAAARLMKTAVH